MFTLQKIYDTEVYQPRKDLPFSALLEEFKLMLPEQCDDPELIFIDPMGEMTVQQIEDFANGLLELAKFHKSLTSS